MIERTNMAGSALGSAVKEPQSRLCEVRTRINELTTIVIRFAGEMEDLADRVNGVSPDKDPDRVGKGAPNGALSELHDSLDHLQEQINRAGQAFKRIQDLA